MIKRGQYQGGGHGNNNEYSPRYGRNASNDRGFNRVNRYTHHNNDRKGQNAESDTKGSSEIVEHGPQGSYQQTTQTEETLWVVDPNNQGQQVATTPGYEMMPMEMYYPYYPRTQFLMPPPTYNVAPYSMAQPMAQLPPMQYTTAPMPGMENMYNVPPPQEGVPIEQVYYPMQMMMLPSPPPGPPMVRLPLSGSKNLLQEFY